MGCTESSRFRLDFVSEVAVTDSFKLVSRDRTLAQSQGTLQSPFSPFHLFTSCLQSPSLYITFSLPRPAGCLRSWAVSYFLSVQFIRGEISGPRFVLLLLFQMSLLSINFFRVCCPSTPIGISFVLWIAQCFPVTRKQSPVLLRKIHVVSHCFIEGHRLHQTIQENQSLSSVLT